jgi:hypothetical protein
MVLEFYLATSKVCLIGLDFAKTAANLRRLLRRHAPVFVKFDRIVRHNRLPFPACIIPAIGRTRQLRNNTTKSYFSSPRVCSYVSPCRRVTALEPQKSRIVIY